MRSPSQLGRDTKLVLSYEVLHFPRCLFVPVELAVQTCEELPGDTYPLAASTLCLCIGRPNKNEPQHSSCQQPALLPKLLLRKQPIKLRSLSSQIFATPGHKRYADLFAAQADPLKAQACQEANPPVLSRVLPETINQKQSSRCHSTAAITDYC